MNNYIDPTELKKNIKKFLEITITAILGICLLISFLTFIFKVNCNGLDFITYLIPMIILINLFAPMATRCLDWLYPTEEETEE